jgi:protocatechuate 3,4-dioxygenase beta subunit
MLDRRKLIRNSGLAGLGVVVAQVAKAATTPPQTEGPFYPVLDHADKDVDLTLVSGRSVRALGEVVIVKGTVRGKDGKPLSGAVVDVWQACATGRYDHPGDPNTRAALDPNFQYFARMLTNNRGEYRFKTIIPGEYPASGNWERPPHIHFRVDAWGLERLTTQMYFKGNRLNDIDQILIDTERRYGRTAKESLIVDFDSAEEDGLPVGTFDLNLGATPATEK